MTIKVNAEVNIQEVFNELFSDELKQELEERGFIVIDSNSTSPNDFKRILIDLINDYNGSSLNYHSNDNEIATEIMENIG